MQSNKLYGEDSLVEEARPVPSDEEEVKIEPKFSQWSDMDGKIIAVSNTMKKLE